MILKYTIQYTSFRLTMYFPTLINLRDVYFTVYKCCLSSLSPAQYK